MPSSRPSSPTPIPSSRSTPCCWAGRRRDGRREGAPRGHGPRLRAGRGLPLVRMPDGRAPGHRLGGQSRRWHGRARGRGPARAAFGAGNVARADRRAPPSSAWTSTEGQGPARSRASRSVRQPLRRLRPSLRWHPRCGRRRRLRATRAVPPAARDGPGTTCPSMRVAAAVARRSCCARSRGSRPARARPGRAPDRRRCRCRSARSPSRTGCCARVTRARRPRRRPWRRAGTRHRAGPSCRPIAGAGTRYRLPPQPTDRPTRMDVLSGSPQSCSR